MGKKQAETMQPDGKTKLDTRQNFLQAVKFTLFSISAGAIQIGVFTLLNEINKRAQILDEAHSYWPFYLFSLVLSVLWNFTLNRNFTFKSAGNVPAAMLKVLCYYAVFTPLSTWWGDALTGPKIKWNEYLVLAFTMIINFVTEFLFDRFVVFGKSINTNKLAKKEEAGQREEEQENADSPR